MKFMSDSVLTLAIVMLLLAPRVFSQNRDTCLVCGDANGDSLYTSADFDAIANFLFAGGPMPSPCADVDGYDLLTVRDLVLANQLSPASCISQPRLVPTPSSLFTVEYADDPIMPGISSIGFNVWIRSSEPDLLKAYTLPLIVKVGGQKPLTIDAIESISTWPGSKVWLKTDQANGSVMVAHILANPYRPNSSFVTAQVHITFPVSQLVQYYTVELGDFGPYMGDTLSAPDSSCNYPMFLDEQLNAWLPPVEPLTTPLCADANHDGQWSISDAVYILSYVFAGGPAPTPIVSGDADHDELVTISDAVRLINYIFAGGLHPAC